MRSLLVGTLVGIVAATPASAQLTTSVFDANNGQATSASNANGNWATASNWVGNTVPTFGTSAVVEFNGDFAYAAQANPGLQSYIFTNRTLAGIRFTGSMTFGAAAILNDGTTTARNLTFNSATGNAFIYHDGAYAGRVGRSLTGSAWGDYIFTASLDVTVVDPAGSVQFTEGATGAGGLNKYGLGTLTLIAPASGATVMNYGGPTSIYQGTLNLNYATTTNASRLPDTQPLRLGQAEVTMTGNQTVGELVGSTQVLADSAARVTRSSTASPVLRLEALTRSTGGTIDFGAASIARTNTSNTNAILGGWATVAGADWAVSDVAANNTLITALASYTPLDTAAGTDTANSDISASATLGGSRTTNSLKVAAPAAGQSLALGSNTLELTSGGLLLTGTNAFEITGDAGGTRLTAGNGSGSFELIVHQYNTGGATISAAIGDSGGNATRLTKTGNQSLTLGGVNTFTGSVAITGGTLALGSGGSIASAPVIKVQSGATFDVAAVTGGFALAANQTLGGTGTVTGGVGLTSLTSVLSPGNSPGILPFDTNQAWTAFTYDWEVNDWTGTTAGTAFDQIEITGSLDLSSGTTYELDLLSLEAGNTSGLVPNFAETARSWTILTTTGGITGFDANLWTIDPSGFSSSPTATGNWSLATANGGQDLVLSYVPVPEPATLGLFGLVGLLAAAGVARRARAVSPGCP